ncbi:MAG TPA: hypothetical protein V6D10_07365 [Trichocoleus sp.]|jgi:hypothetical protein
MTTPRTQAEEFLPAIEVAIEPKEGQVMSEAIELLNQWSQLEPERCKQRNTTFDFFDGTDDSPAADMADPELLDFNFGIVQRQVQKAIVTRKLFYRLESTREGHHYATLRDLDSGCHASGNAAEPALALLQTYVQWLEKSAAKQGAAS